MILDTNALSALFAGDAALGAMLSGTARVSLPVVVLGEYRFGLLRSKQRRAIERALEDLEAVSNLLPIDSGTVRPYASLRDALKRAGTPMPSNDLWIAALAVQHALPIASRDTHFDFVRGVKRLAW